MTADEYLSDKTEVPFDEVIQIPYNELSGYLEEYASIKTAELQKENEQLKIKLEIAELEKIELNFQHLIGAGDNYEPELKNCQLKISKLRYLQQLTINPSA